MSRREFPAKVKVAAFQRCGGLCESCGAVLRPGKFQYDHRVMDAMGGEPTLENCEVLCDVPCHQTKTSTHDIPALAKAKRLEARRLNADRPSRNPLPGGRRSRLKKLVTGEVVDRFTGEIIGGRRP